jgi:tripartite-type tricarboxylate transporter receptor subunit TctC
MGLELFERIPGVKHCVNGLMALIFSLLMLPMGSQLAVAQEFPIKPIRIVVPFAPGGPTDLMARALSKVLSQSLGQQVLVDNKPGGGGLIAFGEIAKSPADGYVIAFPSILAVTNPAMVPNYPYDVAKDFQAITIVGFIPHLLVVRTDSPYKSLAELIAAAKDKPDTLSYASSGNGTSAHLAAAMLVERAGIKVAHVPYRGASPALQDLLAGQTQFMFLDTTSALPQIKGGKLRALAIAPTKRLSSLPELLPIAELGYPGYDIRAWYGLMVRSGTSPAIVQRLHEEVRKALATSEIRELFRGLGIESSGMPPSEYAGMIREDLVMWKRTIERLGIKAE